MCEQTEQQSWFQIDMRDPSHLWNSVDGVYRSLFGCFASRFAKLTKSIVPSTTKSVTFAFAGLQLEEKTVTLNDIQDILTKAEHDLSATAELGLKPVLFIDEANYLYRYLDSKEVGNEILGKVMDFFVQNTKQTKKFSVVLASSSSMFIRRILSHTINRASVFVIGDLSKDEAKAFWECYLPEKHSTTRF